MTSFYSHVKDIVTKLEIQDFRKLENGTVQLNSKPRSTGVIELYANWCPACVSVKDTFISEATELHGKGAFVGAIDCAGVDEDALDSVFGPFLEYFPTFCYVDTDGKLHKLEWDRAQKLCTAITTVEKEQCCDYCNKHIGC
jgi:thiol-disulfide isomerase/thioredoxin